MSKHTYYVMQKSNWAGSTWTPIAWARRRATANELATTHEADGRQADGTVNIGSVRHTLVITKTELVRVFKIDEDVALEEIDHFNQDLEYAEL